MMAEAPVELDHSRKDSLDKLLDFGVELDDDSYDVNNITYDPRDDMYDVGNIMYNLLGDQFVYIWNEYVQALPARINGWDEIFQEITEHGPCEDEGNLLIFFESLKF
ncbi:hypothetical protein SLA2020_265320 [Shorea laevis]